MEKTKIQNKKFFQALAVMIGYIIGVGMFGLPFLVAKAGLVPFFILLIVLIPVQYLLHLIYASMILATRTYHRLPGYTEIYLGRTWKYIVFVAKVFGNMGALLAYIIITGTFVNELLEPILHIGEIVIGDSIVLSSYFIYSTLVFLIEVVIVYFGIAMIAKAELFITTLLILVIGLIVVKGASSIDVTNFVVIDWKYFVLPYGALLLSLDGNGSLPIVAKLVNRDKRAMKSVIRYASFVTAFLTILFTLTVAGVTGEHTSMDALTGLHTVMNGAVVLALLMGVLSMVTSFLGVAESVKETLCWDFKMNKKLAFAITVFVPYALFLSGIEDLIKVITFVGAVGGGVCAIVLVLIFKKIRKKKHKLDLFNYKPSHAIEWFLILLFLLGIVYTLYETRAMM